MGQKLRDDKIGTLSHSVGVISITASALSPSWITIGGQQYKVTSTLSRTIATDITMVANTRYQVYAVNSAGVIQLRISINENSVGPAGFLAWKLVGSFYTSNITPIAFGGFITIEGVPTGEYYFMNNLTGVGNFLTAVTTPPTYGTVATNIVKGRRVGREFIFEWDFKQTTAGAAGSGQYLINTPFPVDLTYHKLNNTQLYVGRVGEMSVVEETSGAYSGVNNAYLPAGTTNQIGVRLGQVANAGATMAQDWSNSFSHFGVAIMEFGLRVRFAVTGWNNTPIKDL